MHPGRGDSPKPFKDKRQSKSITLSGGLLMEIYMSLMGYRPFVNQKVTKQRMALTWKDEDITHFFGCESPSICESQPAKELFIVDYSGKLLRYSFWFLITDECVMISGNDTVPFGADSLYEIVVPCDSVSVCEDPYDPKHTGLAFCYGDPKQRLNLTMILLKRPDGDLKVWPSTVWPNRHLYEHNSQQSDTSVSNRDNSGTEE